MQGRTATRSDGPGAEATGGHGLEIEALLRLARRLRRGELRLTLPDGRTMHVRGTEPGPMADMRLANGRVVRRYLTGGALRFAESYLDGDWDSDDLTTLLELLDRNADAWGSSYYGGIVSRWLRRLRHGLHANTRAGSRRNIHAHYDLGNSFFAAWLDPHMVYSSARFVNGARDLADAQLEKCRALARMIDLRPGHRLLEIGCGWGTFAILAAREFGARVTGITISKEQLAHAQARVQAEGLGDRVEIRFCDYRDVQGRFDRVASIEMFEAVGEAYWPAYFAKVHDCLEPGGRAGLQIITIADCYFDHYRRSPDFIQRYVFPGGMLPSPAVLDAQYARAGLALRRAETFGQDYARTLSMWLDRFGRVWPDLQPMGFDERFRRIWTYYLAYCAAGFRTGAIDVVQTDLARA